MYTNTMSWQFSDKLAARVDISAAYSPFSGGDLAGLEGQQKPQVFLRNAEIAWRPTENVQLHVQIRQSPYGRYASPYGYYSPYGYSSFQRGSFMNATYGSSPDRLFWRDNHRR